MEGLRRISTGGFTEGVIDHNVTAAEASTIHQHGAGVLNGLDLVPGAGLVLNVSEGVAQGLKAARVPAFSALVPDDATNYVWLSFARGENDIHGNPIYEGSLSFTPSPNQPGGSLVCLGKVVAAAGAIAATSTEGRMVLHRWTGERTFMIGDRATFDAEAGTLSLVGAIVAGSMGQTSKAVDGAGIALTVVEARAFSLVLTGSPAPDRSVIVPPTAGKPYAVVNRCAAPLVVKTPQGAGPTIAANKAALVLCDGENVVRLSADA